MRSFNFGESNISALEHINVLQPHVDPHNNHRKKCDLDLQGSR